jgi:arsenite/tail-anchored protein-transporting ATPase
MMKMMNNQSFQPDFLEDCRLNLLLFGGKGGVGKTTSAVAAALRLAARFPERKFLLISTDPAHSVSDSLSEVVIPANLTVREFDSAKMLDEFKSANIENLREIGRRGTFLDDDDINKFLDLSLPGLDEVMAFLEISNLVESGEFSTIIVDTAPTGHTLRLLAMPETLERWLKVLDTLLAKRRYMIQLYKKSYQADTIDKFLLGLNDEIKRMQTLLQDENRSRFIPVMLAEKIVVSETEDLLFELKKQGISVKEILVNRLITETNCPNCLNKHNRQVQQLQNLPEIFGNHQLIKIPLNQKEIRGNETLLAFFNSAFIEDDFAVQENYVGNDFSQPKTDLQPCEFMIFAGKGGVGKTTLSCTTALSLANEFPDKKILLFSSDPAHSIGDCLEIEMADKPVRIKENLSAFQIDASAEFDKLKHLYADEIANLLNGLVPNLDLTFDKEVMERLLDLSPSGVDEVMALVRVLEMLKEEKYDTLVLDSAPTGHLLRLLEMPQLLDAWIKAFFHVLIKYKNIFRMPNLSKKLIEISQGLKTLRSMWLDENRAKLFPVSILTEMSLAETSDLIGSAQNIGIKVEEMFLNLATMPTDCDLCQAVSSREEIISDKFALQFPIIRQTTVYDAGEVVGIGSLEKLGAKIFEQTENFILPPTPESQLVSLWN